MDPGTPQQDSVRYNTHVPQQYPLLMTDPWVTSSLLWPIRPVTEVGEGGWCAHALILDLITFFASSRSLF